MTSIVVVGSDASLLEGVAQMLAASSHSVRVAHSLAEAAALAADEPPLVAVVERELMRARGATAPRLAPGGATLLYHAVDSEPAALPHRVQRATLAEVALPLERNRLVALVHSVMERQQATGREPRRRPPDRDRPTG
jgi:DNA-binding NtrC family response regulator